MSGFRVVMRYSHDITALCGFMFSGKTTVGRALAEITGHAFCDLDNYIELKAKKTVAEIFAEKGEAAFRTLEREAVGEIFVPGKRLIVALGGGTVLDPECLEAIKKVAAVFYLAVPFSEIAARRAENARFATRPLGDHCDDEGLEALYETRRPLYEKAGTRIECEGLSPAQVCDLIATAAGPDQKY